MSPAQLDCAYVRAVSVRSNLRSAGVGRGVYDRFFLLGQRAEAGTASAATTPGDRSSVVFHPRGQAFSEATSSTIADQVRTGLFACQLRLSGMDRRCLARWVELIKLAADS